MSKLFVVGIGPGDLKHMTCEARQALESAEVVVGYATYLDFVEPLLAGKQVVLWGVRLAGVRAASYIRFACSPNVVPGTWLRTALQRLSSAIATQATRCWT